VKLMAMVSPSARAEAERAHAREAELDAALGREEARLADLLRSHADALAGGQDTPEGAVFARVKTVSQLDALRAAIAKIHADRPRLILAAHGERAAALEEQAADLRREAESLRKKLQPHLAALRDLDGVEYVPRAWENYGEDELLASGGVIPLPRCEALPHQAEAAEREAAEWRARVPRDSGTIEGATVEDLLASPHYADPLMIAPPRHLVREWASVALEQAMAASAPTLNGVPLATRCRLRLVWRGGEIDQARSACVRETVRDNHGYVVHAAGPEAA